MAQSGGSLPDDLARLERRLATLRSLQGQGRIRSSDLEAEIAGLTAKDPQGQTWWLAGEAGAWHRWDGQAWVRDDPLKPVRPAPKAKGRSGQGRRVSVLAAVGIAALAGACLLAVGVFLLGGYREYQTLPKIVEDVQVDLAAAEPLPLSDDQHRVRAELGDPEAFMILFYEEPLEDGSIGDVRTEMWSYFTERVEYTFINGELVGEDSIEVDLTGLAPVPYRPEQFRAYMNLQDVVAAAGVDSFLVVPLERELVDGGEVYYADQLTFGLKDDELRYVEALALDVEG